MLIHGITVILHEKTLTGKDVIGSPIYSVSRVAVEKVLVGQPVGDELISTNDLQGKKIEYMLGIPKGDTHEWEDSVVEIFGKEFKTFGPVIQGIEDMIPLEWHKKIAVGRYE